MADLQKYLLNGIVQTKEELFEAGVKKPGVLYFVRTDAKGNEGYLYLNGRKYGDVAEIRAELESLVGSLPTGQTISELFESVNNALGNIDERVEATEGQIASAVTRVENVENALDVLNGDENVEGSIDKKIKDAEKPVALEASTYADAIALATDENRGQIVYLTEDDPTAAEAGASGATAGAYIVAGNGVLAKVGTTTASGDLEGDVVALQGAVGTLQGKINTLNGDDTVEGSVDKKIKDAIEALPADMVVESGRVEAIEGVTYIVLKIKNQTEEIKIAATDLIDVYTAGDELVKVDGYEISLDVDKLKEAIALADYAKGEDLEAAEAELVALSAQTSNIEDKVNELVDNYNEIAEALEEGVKAGEFIAVSDGTVSVVVSEDEGNLLKAGSDNGLFAALYYECYDEEDLNKTI